MPDLPPALQGLPRQHPLTWQRVLLGELQHSAEFNLHIFILRKQIAADYSFQAQGVHFHVLKTRGGLRGPSLFWTDTWLIRKALRQIRPDLVHAWGTERGAALVASRLGYPYLVTMQGLMTWLRQLVPLNIHHRYAAFLERFSLPVAPLITTESKFAVGFLQQRFPKTKVVQVEHAPNWLFHKLNRKPGGAPLRFLFVGTLSFAKGTDLLLQALERLKSELSFELVLVGPAETPAYLHQLKAMVSEALWQRVQYHRGLKPEELAREMSSATLLLFPTRADNSPNAVKEALVAGLPVVASRIGGIPEYLKDGENGLLFEPGNLEDLVQKVRQAAAHPLFSRGLVTPESLQASREYLSPARMGKSFTRIYQELAASARPRASG